MIKHSSGPVFSLDSGSRKGRQERAELGKGRVDKPASRESASSVSAALLSSVGTSTGEQGLWLQGSPLARLPPLHPLSSEKLRSTSLSFGSLSFTKAHV